MFTRNSCRLTYKSTLKAAACALALVAPAAYCDDLMEPVSLTEPMAARLAVLEKAFWVCDYVATTSGVGAAPVELCSTVTDALKNEKFAGDFEHLLEWWKQNKAAQHEELARVAQ
jgi:hypothetical protein